jgi:multicomponent Na+:H+ antiporter subunit D
VTAVFAGLLTKVGVYAIIRVQTLLFPGRFTEVLLVVAALTMLVGICGAIVQSGIKRMLSFTLVSHIGYMVFGIAVGTQAGFGAAIFYVAHHILVQTALFLAAGLVERVAGTTQVGRLGGLAVAAPFLAILFFIPAMNLAGVPPLSGFLGKVGLFQAGLAGHGVLPIVVVVAGAVTSLLTLYAVLRVWGRSFWRPEPEPDVETGAAGSGDGSEGRESARRSRPSAAPPARPRAQAARRSPGGRRAAGQPVRLPAGMVGATAAVVAVGLLLTVAAGPVFGLAERAAADLMDPQQYARTVFDTPADGASLIGPGSGSDTGGGP